MKPKNHTEAKEKYLGKTFQSNNHGCFKIVGYTSSTNVDVRFEDTGYETTTYMSLILRGKVKDRFKPTVQGFGIIGDENIRNDCGVIEKEYRKWESMLNRVYSRPTKSYLDCSVSHKFQKYSDFKDWCNKQIGFGNQGWHLDKDILVKDNKIYSPETCCFVPSDINAVFIRQKNIRGEHPIGVWYNKRRGTYQSDLSVGTNKRKHLGCFNTPEEAFYAYKQAKEDYIKEVAELYKDQIDSRVYEALMKYEVDIND